MPAYTLSPDHTLFDHADATSAIFGAEYDGRKPVLLLFKLSPVQKFIADARKEKDLWAASHILSVLTFSAISTVVDIFGPDAVIYPHLRGNPLFYAWMYSQNLTDSLNAKDEDLAIALIPNKFLALVGIENESDLNELKESIKKNIRNILEELFEPIWNDIVVKKGSLTGAVECASKRLEEKIKSCRDEDQKSILQEELHEISGYRSNSKKDLHRTILLGHFNTTLSYLKLPEIDLSGNREAAYNKLESFIRSLDIPERVEKKYVQWLEMLGSVEANDNKPSRYDLYSLYYELLLEINALDSANFEKPTEPAGYKCTLCGEHLAICGESEVLMRELWKNIHRSVPDYVKESERLCAVCLVKRFYPTFISRLELFKKVDIKKVVPKTESVSEVAMSRRTKVGISWENIYEYLKGNRDISDLRKYFGSEASYRVTKQLEKLKDLVQKLIENVKRQIRDRGQYSDEFIEKLDRTFSNEILYIENLRDSKSLLDTLGFGELARNVEISEELLSDVRDALLEIYSSVGKPPKYYAILVMDGDKIGKLLSGEKLQATENYLHPKLLDEISYKLRLKVKTVRRLITPAAHAAISKAMKNFAVNHVPKIVRDNEGTLIYAGGDDVLALLPVDTAFDVAVKIAETFSKSWNGWEILPGGTMSAGILVVYYKHPLYDALDKVRELERKAKEFGRNAVAIGYLARSGSYDEAVVSWEVLRKLNAKVGEHSILDLIKRSKEREREPPYISERLSYDVARKIDNLPNIGAIKHFLKYELSRHYHGRDEREKKEEIGKLASKLIECAKHVRVTLSKNELEEVLGCKLRKSDVRRVNDLIKCLIRNGKLDENRLRYGCEELEGVGELKITDGYEGLEALILKKQIRGLFTLLKILVDCDADLGCWP